MMRPSLISMMRSACCGDRRIVGDDDDGVAFAVQLLEQRHELGAALAIERAGRLVGEDDLAAVHQRARDADALLLAARELRRAGCAAGRRGRAGSAGRWRALVRAPRVDAGIDRGHLDVLDGVEIGQQLVALEDEAEMLAAQFRQLVGRRACRCRGRRRRSCRRSARSRQPRMFISVDLPEPDAPMMATISPASMSRSTSSSTVTRLGAGGEAPGQAAQRNERGRPCSRRPHAAAAAARAAAEQAAGAGAAGAGRGAGRRGHWSTATTRSPSLRPAVISAVMLLLSPTLTSAGRIWPLAGSRRATR